MIAGYGIHARYLISFFSVFLNGFHVTWHVFINRLDGCFGLKAENEIQHPLRTFEDLEIVTLGVHFQENPRFGYRANQISQDSVKASYLHRLDMAGGNLVYPKALCCIRIRGVEGRENRVGGDIDVLHGVFRSKRAIKTMPLAVFFSFAGERAEVRGDRLKGENLTAKAMRPKLRGIFPSVCANIDNAVDVVFFK